MKMNTVFFLMILFSCQAFAGIGGSSGGPGVVSWAPRAERGTTFDWPVVRNTKNHVFEIHKLCINDDETLGTLRKFKKYEIDLNLRNIIDIKVVKRYSKKMDRVFDQKNCLITNDPKCDFVNQYIEKEVQVPVYKGHRRMTKDGEEEMKDFIRRSKLKKLRTFEIPDCK